KRVRVALGALGLALIICGALLPNLSRTQPRYVIGAKTFTEQYILAALIEQRLQAAGLSATRREGLGSSIVFDALAGNEIDAYVDYSGTIWANQLRRDDVKPREDVLTAVGQWLEGKEGIGLVGAGGFGKAHSLATPRTRAEGLGTPAPPHPARPPPRPTHAGAP